MKAFAVRVETLVYASGVTTEAFLRRTISNVPDVSKALRWLVACGLIVRLEGFKGGRLNAYRYACALPPVC